MRLVFHGGQHLHEAANIVARHARRNGALEVRQMTMHASGHAAPFCRWRDDERPPVSGAHGAGDETAVHQPIQNARQGGALVCEAAVELGDGRGTGGGEQREDMRLALRQRIVFQAGEVEADPVGGAVNGGHEAQGHGAG